ncbi:MAG: putative 2OG-Fe(II) oxygenase, partial [Methylobacter sp.]
VPPNSGDLVFQYHKNPYVIEQESIEAKKGKFVMFDSTIPHFVTKNQSNENRIVISMNFTYVEDND